jgi:hypothetical protein
VRETTLADENMEETPFTIVEKSEVDVALPATNAVA